MPVPVPTFCLILRTAPSQLVLSVKKIELGTMLYVVAVVLSVAVPVDVIAVDPSDFNI